jgi:hypothetical protein
MGSAQHEQAAHPGAVQVHIDTVGIYDFSWRWVSFSISGNSVRLPDATGDGQDEDDDQENQERSAKAA